MKKRRIRALPAAAAMLAALSVALAVYSRAQADKVGALETAISAAHERAFYEAASLLGGIEVNLEKAQVADGALRRTLLGRISRDAAGAQSNLALLPASLSAVSASLKFVNQTGDAASALLEKLNGGGALEEGDLELLARLHESCVNLNNLIDGIAEDAAAGRRPLSEAAKADPATAEETLPQASIGIDYPMLLYDGPFSDGRDESAFEPEGETFTADEALSAARRFIGADRVRGAWITGEGSVPAPSYEISAQTDDGLLSLAVTKRGGQVLYMMVDGAAGDAAYSHASLIDMAAAFLKSRGYPPVSVSYWASFGGYLTVNFAALQDGVILYPDLIKVQMSQSSGLPVGFEAVEYLANHHTRAKLTPSLDESAAQARLNPVLESEEGRLCVVPLAGGGEALCWEFAAQMDGARYLVYIDAQSGEERNIYRVVGDENGQLVI